MKVAVARPWLFFYLCPVQNSNFIAGELLVANVRKPRNTFQQQHK